MRIDSGNSIPLDKLDPVQATEAVQEKVQISMLKKTLDSQSDQAAQLLSMLQGKGKIVDYRA